MSTVIRFFKKKLARRDSKCFLIIFKRLRFHILVLRWFNPSHTFTSLLFFLILILFSHLHIDLPLRFSQSTCTCAFRNFTCTLHAPLFPPFLISSFEYCLFNRTHCNAPHYASFLVLFYLFSNQNIPIIFFSNAPRCLRSFFFWWGGEARY